MPNVIYQIKNIVNGKVYVGSAVNPSRRFSVHLHQLRKGKHHSSILQKAWGKYGEANFQFEILEVVEHTRNLLEREQFWLDSIGAASRENGYNICPTAGSTLGRTHDETTRAKMRKPKSVSYPRKKGHKLPEATCFKMSQARLGLKHSEETKAKIGRKGSESSHSVLTEADVLFIRAEVAAKRMTQRALAQKYSIGPPHINRIVKRLAWAHI